jgi:hypothetical protein
VDVIESSFKSTSDLVGELVVLYTKLSMFSKFLVHGWNRCESLGEKHSILVHSGAKLNLTLVHMLKSTKTSLTLKWANIESSLFKPPHQLQTCTENLLKMKSFLYTKQPTPDQIS